MRSQRIQPRPAFVFLTGNAYLLPYSITRKIRRTPPRADFQADFSLDNVESAKGKKNERCVYSIMIDIFRRDLPTDEAIFDVRTARKFSKTYPSLIPSKLSPKRGCGPTIAGLESAHPT